MYLGRGAGGGGGGLLRVFSKQASGPHTNTLGQEIKSPIQMTDFELMTYTSQIMMCRVKVI